MKTEDQVWQEAAEVLGKALGMRYDFATGPFGRTLFDEMVGQVAKNVGKYCDCYDDGVGAVVGTACQTHRSNLRRTA